MNEIIDAVMNDETVWNLTGDESNPARVDRLIELGLSQREAVALAEHLPTMRENVSRVNGRRRTRLITVRDAVRVVLWMVRSPYGWESEDGGSVANAYGYTATRSIVLAVGRTDGTVELCYGEINAKKNTSLTRWATGLNENAPAEKFAAWADSRQPVAI